MSGGHMEKEEILKAEVGFEGTTDASQGKGKRGNGPVKGPGLAVSLIIAAAMIAVALIIRCLLPGMLPWAGSGDLKWPALPEHAAAETAMMAGDAPVTEAYAQSLQAPPWGDDDIFAMLIIGRDYDYNLKGARITSSPGRADAIMLLALSRKSLKGALISIPRDTLAQASSSGKINALYHGNPPSALMAAVRDLTGIAVDRWATVDFQGFVKIIDLLGGIEVDVSKQMRYTDRAGGYSIDLSPGTHHLDGAGALKYVRYRSDAFGDIARVERHLDFAVRLVGKAASWNTAGKLFAVAKLARDMTSTDLASPEAVSLGARLLLSGTERMKAFKVPGSFHGTSWMADAGQLRKQLKEALALP